MKTMLKLAAAGTTAFFAGAVCLTAAPATEIWENTCASCHGIDGTGQTKQGKKLKLKDYTDPAALAGQSDEQLAKIIADGVTVDGKQRKKGYKDELTPAEITALVKFIRSLSR
jgi:mono/diheme cytochrome c family protein